MKGGGSTWGREGEKKNGKQKSQTEAKGGRKSPSKTGSEGCQGGGSGVQLKIPRRLVMQVRAGSLIGGGGWGGGARDGEGDI